MSPVRHRPLARTLVVGVALAVVVVLSLTGQGPRASASPAPSNGGALSTPALAPVDTATPGHLSAEAATPLRLVRADLADPGRWLPILLLAVTGLTAVAWGHRPTRSSASARLRWQRAATRFRRGPPGLQLT